MNGIIEFLRARYDEAEQQAQAAGGDTWRIRHSCDKSGDSCWCCGIESDRIRIYDEGGHDPLQAQHIVAHDPASVLRDIAAKRAVLEYCENAEYAGVTERNTSYSAGERAACRLALNCLARPFELHPDFDEQWRP